MLRISATLVLLLVACGGSSPSAPDGGVFSDAGPSLSDAEPGDAGQARLDAAAADAGPPSKGDRRLGIDVSTASGESFLAAFDVASASGMDFITLPLNWRDIEPGPDDDFHFTSIDTKKWRRTVVTGILEHDSGGLRWLETGAGVEQAEIHTSYRLSSADASVSADITLTSADLAGTESTLLLRFSPSAADTAGNRCAGVEDDYVAVVLIGGAGDPSVAMATCTDGVFATQTVASAGSAALRVRLRRQGDNVIAEYRQQSSTAFSELGTVAATSFGAPARPYLYFGNPSSGTVDIMVDDFTVTGDAAWDDPDDRFTSDPAFDILGIVDLVYGDLPVSIGLSIRTINTVAVEIPSDLSPVDAATGLVNFGTQTMRDRFKAVIDHIYGRIPGVNLRSTSVGNEVNGYLGTNATAWAQYKAFVDEVAPYARTAWTRATIVSGVKTTHHGLIEHTAEVAALNEHTDVVMLTYYPLQSDFTVQDPGVVHSDFDSMVAKLASAGLSAKPIYLLEVGFPSAPSSAACPLCNSSEQKQAEFVTNVFSAWDAHRTAIASVNFNWLTDVSQTTVDEWKQYYGVDVPTFLEFLRTLGYRTEDGTAKQAWGTLTGEAVSRGWVPRP